MDFKKEIQRVTVKGIIHSGGKILLLQDGKGKWELPGGKIVFGEDPKITLARELSEELGLEDVEVENIIDAWSFCVDAKDEKYQFIVLIYECLTHKSDFNLSGEHIKLEWISFEDIPKLNMQDGYKNSLAIYQRLLLCKYSTK